MNRITAILFAILFPVAFASGQRTIRGTVTSSHDNKPLKGVLITPKDKKMPVAITGNDGRYMIAVDENTLVLSARKKGFINTEVEIGRNFIDIVLEPEPVAVQTLKEQDSTGKKVTARDFSAYKPDSVKVVNADIGYGLTRRLSTSSSLRQVIGGTELNPAFTVNINNMLAGKVTGLKLFSQSGMALGRNGSVSLRGPTGLSTGEGVSYYLGGILISDVSDIPYNDIESVTVLPGPSSSSLLGSYGKNGAVMISTGDEKTGDDNSGIIFNSGFQVSRVSILPEYQNSYAGGGYDDFIKYTWEPGHPEAWKTLDGKYYHDYSDDASWGPPMSGQEYIPWYAWYEGTPYTGKTALLYPQPDNVKDFYNTGLRFSNSVKLFRKSERMFASSTIGNLHTRGNIPYTSIDKNYFTVKANYSVNERITLESSLYFFTTMRKGEINDEWSNQTTGSFNSWYHRDLETIKLKEFENYRLPGTNVFSSWNHSNPTVYWPESPLMFFAPSYWINPYSYFESKTVNERTDRFMGRLALKYRLSDNISAEISYRGEAKNYWYEEKVPIFFNSGAQSYYDYDNYYMTKNGFFVQDNFTAILNANRTIGDFSFDVDAGLDIIQSRLKTNGARTTSGLIIQGLYTVSNSRDLPRITNERSELKTRSLFLQFAAGYRDVLFFDFLVRPEWHSTLPADDNMLISNSFGGAFVFSKLLAIPLVDYGKLRLSRGVIPSGLKPYQYPGIGYQLQSNPNYYFDRDPFANWNGNYLSATPDLYMNNNIKGPVKKETEIGIDLVLLRNSITLGLTYWTGREEGIPLNNDLPGYSGFSVGLMNTGAVEKKGVDISIILYPVRSEKLSWKSAFFISKLYKNEVVSLGSGLNRLSVQSLWSYYTPSMFMSAGKAWGLIIGNGMETKNGKPLLDTDGSYISKPDVAYGSVYPDITGGLQNEIRIGKNMRINVNFDFQGGGKFFSLSQMWGTYGGITSRTAYINDKGFPVRFPVTDGGGVHVTGVDRLTFDEVDYYINAQEYFHGFYNDRIFNSFIFDAGYIKLRELSFSYKMNFRGRKTGSFLKGAEITVYSENLCMVWAAQKNFDPSELQFASGEKGQFPSVRSFGTNLRFEF